MTRTEKQWALAIIKERRRKKATRERWAAGPEKDPFAFSKMWAKSGEDPRLAADDKFHTDKTGTALKHHFKRKIDPAKYLEFMLSPESPGRQFIGKDEGATAYARYLSRWYAEHPYVKGRGRVRKGHPRFTVGHGYRTESGNIQAGL